MDKLTLLVTLFALVLCPTLGFQLPIQLHFKGESSASTLQQVLSNQRNIKSTRKQLASTKMESSITNQPIRFVTNKMCPYAQRTWIALREADIPFEMVEISLYGAGGKPGWFMKLNPRGEVPVLDCTSVGLGPVVGSEATLDAIATKLRPIYHPSDPHKPLVTDKPEVQERVGQIRSLIASSIAPTGKRAVLGGGGASDVSTLNQQLQVLEQILEESDDGPFLAGTPEPSLADASAFPFLWRIKDEFGIPDTCPKLKLWYDEVMARPQISGTVQSSWWWWW